MTFAPMKCNPAPFSDLQKFGGAKIAINNNRLYIGTIVDGKRHGKGLYNIRNSKLKGYWVEDTLNGCAIVRIGRFYKFKGNFKNFKREGYGE